MKAIWSSSKTNRKNYIYTYLYINKSKLRLIKVFLANNFLNLKIEI